MVLEAKTLSKSYVQGDGTDLPVLTGLELKVNTGETIAIMGESGSGKTTLLNCISGLDHFNGGQVLLCGDDISRMKDKELADLRNKRLGFVFQFHYLLKDFSVVENVMIPCLIAGIPYGKAKRKASELLEKVKLSSKWGSSPRHLSGGEQQRVAIARALVMSPQILVMDEPTGNLDEHLTAEVMGHIINICSENRTGIVVATHNKKVAGMMGKTYELHLGKLKEKKL
jgi:lipoprotein-releasing system ATP-binding protein